MSTGTVKFFNESKGYGFIVEDESQNEVFVHVSGLTEMVKENDKVTYEVVEGRKGLNAVNVKKVGAGDAPAAAPADTSSEEE
ncbi:MAG: cold-shock protein [Cyclobacteriaceae bacterium]